MKLWNNYKKEMKIASRGFYFYVELVVAFIILSVLLFVVPIESNHKIKEVIFCDITDSEFEKLMNIKEGKGYNEQVEDVVFKLKPSVLTYKDDSGKLITKEFKDKKKVTAKQYLYHDTITGKHAKTKYIVDNFDDMMRIAYSKKYIGTEMWYGEDNKDYYHNILFGYETDKYKNIVEISHGTVDVSKISSQMNKEIENTEYLNDIETLNNRENYIPIILIMMNGLLGMMVIIAYISVDKSEGVLKALRITPLSIGNYLMSKILVALTTVLISSVIISVPVMGLKPNYLLLFISVISMSFLSCAIGIFISTFFEDVKSAFGAIMIVGVILMVPVISYMVHSFHPNWIEYMPSYYMLESIKESLFVNGSSIYILTTSCFLAFVGIIFYLVSKKRYKNILGM